MITDQNKIDILTGAKPGVHVSLKDKHFETQKYKDQYTLSFDEFEQKYSPYYNPSLRLTLDEIKILDEENLLLFRQRDAKRHAQLVSNHKLSVI